MTRALVATVALLVLVPVSAVADTRYTATCGHQSSTYFPGAYREASNLVIGPLAWLGARADGDTDGALGSGYRWKHPVLVRPGHAVTVRVGAAAAGFARLTYAHADGWRFSSGVRTVVFKACSAARAMSRTDGRPVTFWSGGIVARRGSICLPVEIRIDRGPVRKRTIALNADC